MTTGTTFRNQLNSFHPLTQLAFLVGICVVFSIVFSMLAMPLVYQFWDINILTDYGALEDHSNPNAIAATRLLMLFSHLGTFVVPALLFAFLMHRNVPAYFKMNRAHHISQWFYLIPIMVLALPIIHFFHEWNQHMELPEFLSGLEATMKQLEETSMKTTMALLKSDSTGTWLANMVVIAIVPAIGEELIFRGVVQKLFVKWSKNIHLGIWLAAILFSVMHMQFYGFIPRMLMGALLGYIFVYSGSIFLPMLAHFFNNGFVVTLHYLIGDAEKVEEVENVAMGTEHEWLSLLITTVLFVLFFFPFWKRRKPLHLD